MARDDYKYDSSLYALTHSSTVSLYENYVSSNVQMQSQSTSVYTCTSTCSQTVSMIKTFAHDPLRMRVPAVYQAHYHINVQFTRSCCNFKKKWTGERNVRQKTGPSHTVSKRQWVTTIKWVTFLLQK